MSVDESERGEGPPEEAAGPEMSSTIGPMQDVWVVGYIVGQLQLLLEKCDEVAYSIVPPVPTREPYIRTVDKEISQELMEHFVSEDLGVADIKMEEVRPPGGWFVTAQIAPAHTYTLSDGSQPPYPLVSFGIGWTTMYTQLWGVLPYEMLPYGETFQTYVERLLVGYSAAAGILGKSHFVLKVDGKTGFVKVTARIPEDSKSGRLVWNDKEYRRLLGALESERLLSKPAEQRIRPPIVDRRNPEKLEVSLTIPFVNAVDPNRFRLGGSAAAFTTLRQTVKEQMGPDPVSQADELVNRMSWQERPKVIDITLSNDGFQIKNLPEQVHKQEEIWLSGADGKITFKREFTTLLITFKQGAWEPDAITRLFGIGRGSWGGTFEVVDLSKVAGVENVGKDAEPFGALIEDDGSLKIFTNSIGPSEMSRRIPVGLALAAVIATPDVIQSLDALLPKMEATPTRTVADEILSNI